MTDSIIFSPSSSKRKGSPFSVKVRCKFFRKMGSMVAMSSIGRDIRYGNIVQSGNIKTCAKMPERDDFDFLGKKIFQHGKVAQKSSFQHRRGVALVLSFTRFRALPLGIFHFKNV